MKKRKINILLFILITVLFFQHSIAGKAETVNTRSKLELIADSMDLVLDTMTRNENYIKTLTSIELMLMDSPKFLHYAELKEKEGYSQNLMKYVCESYSDRAIYYNNLGNLDSFYYWRDKMNPLALELKEFNYYFFLGNIEVGLLIRKNMTEQAIQTAKKLYETAKEYDNEDGIIAANMSIGTAMKGAQRNEEAKEAYETALALLLKNDGRKAWLLNTYSHLIMITDELENPTLSLEYANQKEQLVEDILQESRGTNQDGGYMLNELYDTMLKKVYIYIKLKNPEKAWSQLKKIQGILPTVSERIRKQFHHAACNYYDYRGEYHKALSELDLVYDYYFQKPANRVGLMKQKAMLLGKTGAYQESIKAYEELVMFQDSINDQQISTQLSELRTIYDTDHLKLVNSELELKNKHDQMRAALIVLALSISALVFITLMYVRIFRIKKKLEHSEEQLLQEKESLKIAKEKAEEARDIAQRAERKESFFANMSHEIRTPLNAIVGFSNLLVSDEEVSDEERKLFIKTINQNCDQLLKLVNDVLDLSRMESGKMSFTFDNYNLTEVMEEVYSTHKMMIPKQLQFLLTVPEKAITVHIDKMRLKQVVFNFINNATKFTTEGHIRIGYELDKEKRAITIFVEDTGRGIPEEHQKKIFERFYKQNDTDQGTGLGLSISTIIAERQGGRLSLTSEEGKGSCFSIILPYDNTIQ